MASITRAPTGTRGSAMRRPGWVTFGAVIAFFVAGFQALVSLSEFSNSTWLFYTTQHTYSLWNSHMFWWGVIDAVIAAIAFFGAVDLLRGGAFGLVVVMSGALFSAMRWLFYIPAAPVMAVVIIAIDVLVVFGLSRSMDFFAQDDYSQ